MEPEKSPALRNLRGGVRRQIYARWGVRGMQVGNAAIFGVLALGCIVGIGAFAARIGAGGIGAYFFVYAGVAAVGFVGSLWYRFHKQLGDVAADHEVESLMTRVRIEELTQRMATDALTADSQHGLSFDEAVSSGGELSVAALEAGATSLAEDEEADESAPSAVAKTESAEKG